MNGTDACLNPRIGNLIARYEFDTLSSRDRGSFEDHLMECPFCRDEVEQMMPAARLLRSRRAAIKRQIVESPEAMATSRAVSLIERLKKTVQEIVGLMVQPIVFAPALGAVAIALLLLVLRPNLTPNPYSAYLSFDPLPYQSTIVRGIEGSKPEFNVAMEAYNLKNYTLAAALLEKDVAVEPNNWTGWFYLGVCRYLERKPDQALAALTRADELSKYSFKAEIRWYLMQAYLLDRNVESADSVHKLLSATRGQYAARADSLWGKVSKAGSR